ncbi:MAG: histone deacetylase family protein [Gammaproteobacteria bacterium]|nr:histone deacetylase family protein [Gammaproteobacteria bacterium]
MKTVYSDDHNLHAGLQFPRGDAWGESAECPVRANNVATAIREHDFGEVVAPKEFGDDRYLRLHAPDYVEFLKTVWDEWVASGGRGNARPDTFVGAGMRHADTDSVVGRLGRYSFDSTSPFVAGSWQAIRTSANIALTGAEIIKGSERFAFSACRPPGHHATETYCGGYCYLNNNSLAAQSLLDSGARRVAILDVDYHHGNGTQSIFYARNDVLTISLHADPRLEYPFFLGYADEVGEGKGHGFNVNFPLPFGTAWDSYEPALEDALAHVRRFSPDALVVALGLDTFVGDPTTHFGITTEDFARMGEAIGRLGLSTLTVLEGGYSTEWIGRNTVSFLSGLESA